VSEDVAMRGATVDMSLTKSSVPLRDQPMNVSVVSSRLLQTFAITDLTDALARVPNVNAYQQYGVYEYYQFRGFDTDAQMVDGVRNEGNRVRSQLSNVERIDVLKGPAAVLSGTDAIGSAINIVLKKPTARPLYDAQITAGSFETTRLSGGVSRQLGRPSLLFRVDAGLDRAENFRHDPSTKFNITPTVSWQPTVSEHVEVRYAYNRNDLSGDSGIPVLANANGTLFIPDVPRDRRYNTPQDFALSEDHNIRVSYTRPIGRHLGFRNVFAPRIFDDEYWVAESMSVPTGSTLISRTFASRPLRSVRHVVQA
jgi:iron complex outermembrane receptor protein